MHRTTSHVLVTILVLLHAVLSAPWISRLRRPRADERGDVPGWVLITVMTAGLVAGLWAIAGPALENMLKQALDSVR